jgi:fatty acid desaturase
VETDRELRVEEFGCAVYNLALIICFWTKVISWQVAVTWYAGISCGFFLHFFRSFVNHVYAPFLREPEGIDGLRQSLTVSGGPFLTELWAPLGISYHGLHHVVPSLPYHSLRKAHQALRKKLPVGHAYFGGKINFPTFFDVLRHQLSVLKNCRESKHIGSL